MDSCERICKEDRVRVYNHNREGYALEFFKKCAEVHNNKYDYSKAIYKNAHQKICIICKIHGEFFQLANDHKNGSGCKKCKFTRSLSKLHEAKLLFITKAQKKYNNAFDYSLIDYVNSNTKINIKCLKHNTVFSQTPNNHLHGEGYGCGVCYIERKREQTCSNTDEFIIKANEIYNNKYNYSLVQYTNSKTPINIICEEHGMFSTIPNSHLNGAAGCKACGLIKQANSKIANTAESYYERIKLRHPNISLYDNYAGMFKTISFECIKHGTQETTAINLMCRDFPCPKCSKKFSMPEQKLTKFLLSNKINVVNHYKIPNTRLEIDIYLPDYNVGIEVNGIYYHCENGGNRGKHYHLQKSNLCLNNNIRLLHFTDTEINDKFAIISSKILSAIKIYKTRIFARKTIVKEIDMHAKRNFLDSNHIQGDDRSSLWYGLFYNNKLVSVMTFGRRKITGGDAEYELMRFACEQNVQIIGGFSKLLKKFKASNPHIKNIKTYADMRYSCGNVYEETGFKLSHNSAPSYWYFKLPSLKLYHRFNFAKHKLQNRLEIYDENKSEWDNMKTNGYDRIWDCGNAVYYMQL